MIVVLDLNEDQEGRSLPVLRKNKETIRWTLSDIKCIGPSIIKHKIHLQENDRHCGGHQRCLKLTL